MESAERPSPLTRLRSHLSVALLSSGRLGAHSAVQAGLQPKKLACLGLLGAGITVERHLVGVQDCLGMHTQPRPPPTPPRVIWERRVCQDGPGLGGPGLGSLGCEHEGGFRTMAWAAPPPQKATAHPVLVQATLTLLPNPHWLWNQALVLPPAPRQMPSPSVLALAGSGLCPPPIHSDPRRSTPDSSPVRGQIKVETEKVSGLLSCWRNAGVSKALARAGDVSLMVGPLA